MTASNTPRWQRSPQIRLQNVSQVYENDNSKTIVALDSIFLDVYLGELVSVIGPSGSGKTTLLYLIAGFTSCTTGRIIVGEQPVEGPSHDRTMIFQEHNLFPWKTVLQNVAFGPKAQGLTSKQQISIAQQYINLVQLKGFEHLFPHQLSGGMRQRVAIARALAVKPTCILMDEPFGSLDAQLRSKMQDELLKILAEEKSTILFVTHDIEEAIYLSDRVVIFSQRPGRIRKVINIPLARPRKLTVKLSPKFQELKKTILDEMNTNSHKTNSLASANPVIL